MFFCEIRKIFKSTFFYRKPPVAASLRLHNILRSIAKWHENILELIYKLMCLIQQLPMFLPYRNQSVGLLFESIGWFLYNFPIR